MPDVSRDCSRSTPGAGWAPDAACAVTGTHLLAWRREQLAAGGESEALDWLLAMAAGLDWSTLQHLRIAPERSVSLPVSLDQLTVLWQRHLQFSEPLQYLLQRCSWRDLELVVAPGVLIPRPETELLVEMAQALRADRPPTCWADLGTGSGCLAVALAGLWPTSEGLAVDCSDAALRQAARNLERCGRRSRVQLLQGSWWQPLHPWWGRLDLVVANPPYIPTAVWSSLEPVVRTHEPRLALDGGSDGLDALRLIVSGCRDALAPGGWLLLEHHHDQSRPVLDLLRGAGLEQVAAHPDLEGTLRFAVARAPVA